ncbi:MAG: hypothetical protein ABEN55_20420 [Bradymonadaceae bacterium]
MPKLEDRERDDDGYLTVEGYREYLAEIVGVERYLRDPIIAKLVDQQVKLYRMLVDAEKRLEDEGIEPPRKKAEKMTTSVRERDDNGRFL